jgi:hypothetical protein
MSKGKERNSISGSEDIRESTSSLTLSRGDILRDVVADLEAL